MTDELGDKQIPIDPDSEKLLKDVQQIREQQKGELEEDIRKERQKEIRRFQEMPNDEQITALLTRIHEMESREEELRSKVNSLELQIKLYERESLDRHEPGDLPKADNLDPLIDPSKSAFQRIYAREEGESIKREIGEGNKPSEGPPPEGEAGGSGQRGHELGRPGGPERG